MRVAVEINPPEPGRCWRSNDSHGYDECRFDTRYGSQCVLGFTNPGGARPAACIEAENEQAAIERRAMIAVHQRTQEPERDRVADALAAVPGAGE